MYNEQVYEYNKIRNRQGSENNKVMKYINE